MLSSKLSPVVCRVSPVSYRLVSESVSIGSLLGAEPTVLQIMTAQTAAPRSTLGNVPVGILDCVRVPRISAPRCPAVVLLLLPVLLVAATSLVVAAVSGLAKRTRSGLALTWWTRPRSLCSEEDGYPSLEGCDCTSCDLHLPRSSGLALIRGGR